MRILLVEPLTNEAFLLARNRFDKQPQAKLPAFVKCTAQESIAHKAGQRGVLFSVVDPGKQIFRKLAPIPFAKIKIDFRLAAIMVKQRTFAHVCGFCNLSKRDIVLLLKQERCGVQNLLFDVVVFGCCHTRAPSFF
ncbi:hypothetical protein SDC9_203558 [bioreactor metagenome]|uniref:Uncharacterized protein n=1 Tax=bioreactor metagenome TaxID=1076179 RepID=A0A645J5X3_9ZZZZ